MLRFEGHSILTKKIVILLWKYNKIKIHVYDCHNISFIYFFSKFINKIICTRREVSFF